VSSSLLLSILRDGDAVLPLAPRAWERLLHEARKSMLLASLAEQAKAQGWYGRIPVRPQRHFEAALRSCASQQHMVRWELGHIERAFARLGVPVVLLKGAAYVMADRAAAKGRVFSDIDIMVPRESIEAAEAALIAHGWFSQVQGYDRQYYERWMHELPALQHVQRQSVIDLHHTIAPPTSRTPVDARRLFAGARPLPDSRLFFVLAPADMLLHSAVHLMQEGEFEHGLRDLRDLHALFSEFGQEPGFWSGFCDRASELGLGRPLYYAVEQARRMFGTPMPQEFVAAVERFRPGFPARNVMRSLFGAALAGAAAGESRRVDLSRWLLYVRGHYMRMPLHLLVPHLMRKGGMRLASLRRGRPVQAFPVGNERTAN
jgi:hypothetical protein